MKLIKTAVSADVDPVTEYQPNYLSIQVPPTRVLADKVVDNAGTGKSFRGKVYFISNSEVVVVPTQCKATNIFSAVSRMPRVAKTGLPKQTRKGKANRLYRVVVEMAEYA